MASKIIKQLQQMRGDPTRLKRTEYDEFLDGESGTKSLVATFQAPNPLVLRPDSPLYIVAPAFETFTSSGNGNQETFNLSNSITQSPQSVDLILFADGSQVSEDSIDYSNDTFDYTDGGAQEDLAVYYISDESDASLIIEREAPPTDGNVSDRVFDTPLSLMHQRDQNEQPRHFQVGQSPLQRVVPTNWKINVFVDASYQVKFEDSANGGTTAINGLLSLPYKQGHQRVDGLGKAVARNIVDRS
jgi:hypothetical protein